MRLRGFLDAVLARCVDRALSRIEPPVLDVLRMGAYQLLAMRVPPHAAVATSVELSRRVTRNNAGGLVNAVLRKVLGEKYGADLSNCSDSEVIDTIEYHVFPNMVLFPGISLPMVYRFRPIGSDPNRTLFEILFLRPRPASGEAPEPPEPYLVREHESYSTVPGMDPAFGAVYDQDTDNLRAQQQGFRASATGVEILGNYQEVRIRHFQQVVDKYLGAGDA